MFAFASAWAGVGGKLIVSTTSRCVWKTLMIQGYSTAWEETSTVNLLALGQDQASGVTARWYAVVVALRKALMEMSFVLDAYNVEGFATSSACCDDTCRAAVKLILDMQALTTESHCSKACSPTRFIFRSTTAARGCYQRKFSIRAGACGPTGQTG